MKNAKYIAVLVALFFATACVNLDTDVLEGNYGNSGDVIQVQGRVVRFEDMDVTRASKDPALGETRVTSMAIALFPIEGDEIQPCIYFTYEEGSNLIFTIDRGDVIFNGYDNEPFAMYIFANMPSMADVVAGPDCTLAKLKKEHIHEVSTSYVTSVPPTGFPMMGSLGDYTASGNKAYDGKRFILKPSKGTENPNGLPTVEGNPTDYLPVPMPAMYAKFSFDISLETEQYVKDGVHAKFSMDGYSINNIPRTVDFDETTNSDVDVLEGSNVVLPGVAENTSIKFDFYLPERLLTPETSAEEYKYPLGDNSALVDYDDIPADRKKYAQRYKGKLLGEDQKATYITINGSYRTHQDHKYNVSYDIYLGEDNYGDFNIRRNMNYVNKVIIKGLTASKNQAVNGGSVAIDHRVTATNSATPLIMNLRRETLLDSHFEVRPLRVRLNPIYLDDDNNPISGAKVTVQVLNAVDPVNGAVPDWVRLEYKNSAPAGDATYCENGKRKYFTTNLVTEMLKEGGKTISAISLENGGNHTFWIYVDENTEVCNDDEGGGENGTAPDGLIDDDVRSARIRITYSDNTRKVYEPIDYIINQHALYPVESADGQRTYYIEYHEEYLYNYDSEDLYGQTLEEGLPWGLNDVQLSKQYKSFKIGEDNTKWNAYYDAVYNEDNYYLFYDFYIESHDAFAKTNKAQKVRSYAGQEFTKEIVSTAGIQYLTMAEQAESAVQYCYNRNKINSEGKVDTVKWYLPSVDELEDFIVSGYGRFEEFQDNYYWTSQPAYNRNAFYYEYRNWALFGSGKVQDTYAFEVYEDNLKYARATKVVYDSSKSKFIAAKSGLDDEPPVEEDVPSDAGAVTDIMGYYGTWHHWYYQDYNSDVTITHRTSNQVYNDIRDGDNIKNEDGKNKRYYSFVNPNYDMSKEVIDPKYDMRQDGYQLRTKKNRVRCAYRKAAN